MNSRTLPTRKGFTLLEVLMVVVIIFILAALLLPVIEKARSRSRQAECVSQLRQLGIAYHGFAHDHGDQFPFHVSTNQGGTLEFVQAGERLGDGIQFAYRHFQALSNDLQSTRILVCPADRRLPAETFADLQNRNVSYFAAVTVEYSKPDSILAGDGNIAAEGDGRARAIVNLRMAGANWTAAGHGWRGNLLFSDGHVEQTTKAGLNYALGQQAGPVSAWLPVADPLASVGRPSPSRSSPSPPPAPRAKGGSGGGPAVIVNNSGFAALQNFFQPPGSPSTPSPNSSGSPTASTPPAPAAPASPPVLAPPAAPQPMPAAAAEMAAKPSTNQPPPASANAPELAGTEPSRTAEGQAPVNMFMVFVKPERCWYCWLIILVLGLATAFLLGMEIRRRRAQHQQQPLPGQG